MRRVADAVYHLVLTLWVGGMWIVAYLAVPMLFKTLPDRVLAGQLAGHLFSGMGVAGLACAAYVLAYLAIFWRRAVLRQAVFWLVVAVAVLVAVGQFGLQPMMAAMKAAVSPMDVMDSPLRDRFVLWHGVASVLYLMQSVLGAALVVFARRGVR